MFDLHVGCQLLHDKEAPPQLAEHVIGKMPCSQGKLGTGIDDVENPGAGIEVERDLHGARSVPNDVAEQLANDELGLIDELVAGSDAAQKLDELRPRVDRRTRIFGSKHPCVHHGEVTEHMGGAPAVVLLVHRGHKTIDASADIATASRRKLIGENISPPLGRHPGMVALISAGKERNSAKL